MGIKYFGQYLLDKGIVSRETLVKAIELQEQQNLRLGELSLAMGYVTQLQEQKTLKLADLDTSIGYLIKADVEKALEKQYPMNMTLGDLLQEIGISAHNQLNSTVKLRRNAHLYIGESLVHVGALTDEQLLQHMEDFKADQAEYIPDKIELPQGVSNSSTWEMAADMTFKMLSRVINLHFNPGKCQSFTETEANYMMAAMDISGDVEARYIISVSEKLQKAVARAILHEETVDGQTAELLDDTVMEFVNVVCGNVAAKCSQMGKNVNISPPVTIRPNSPNLIVPEGHLGLCFPINVGDDEKMELILLIKS